MAFLVEDGAGVKGANSYCTVAYMRSYFADRGVDLTAVTDGAVEAALIAATDYIDTRWGNRFRGLRLWSTLKSHSVFTLTAQPTAGETVTVGSDTFTFQVDAVAATDVEIGLTLTDTLSNLITAIADTNTDGVFDSYLLIDPDAVAIAIYFTCDGVTTVADTADGDFSAVASTGLSGKRQPLEFPRSILIDDRGQSVVGIPEKLKMATCEYANRARTTALAPDGTIDNTIISQSTSVGPISKSVSYNTGAALNPIKAYPAADRLLREYIRRSTGIVRN